MKAILLVDHGSIRDAANHMIECVGNLTQLRAGSDVIVRVAHMELAEPTIADALASCVAAGATDVVVFPYMLSPGKHSTRDIPRMAAEAAAAFPSITVTVTPAFGVHDALAEVVLERAGVTPVAASAPEACQCMRSSDRPEGWCGDACRANASARTAQVR